MVLKTELKLAFNEWDLSGISEKYHREGKKPIAFDFKIASNAIFTKKNGNNNGTHNIHYYPGRIFPYIPFFMLSLSDFEEFTGCVLDPFAGSGTVLLESITNPFVKRNAIGIEKNPIGRLISKVKVKPLNEIMIDELSKKISSEYIKNESAVNEISEFTNRKLWFSDKAFKNLSRLKYSIEQACTSQDYRDFFWLCYSAIIRKASKANPYIPPPVVLKPENYSESEKVYEKLKKNIEESEDPDILKKFTETVYKNKNRIAALNDIAGLKEGTVRSEIIWDDAKHIKKGKTGERGKICKEGAQVLKSGSVALVLTSPPYLTAQKYIRTNKLELFCLGYTEDEVRSLEKSSIGTEQVSMTTEILPLNIETIDKEIAHVNALSKERAVQVYQYFKDMLDTLFEINRVLQENAYAILVLGDNKVLKKNVKTYKLLTEAAVNIGFEELVILKDTIRSRSMLTKRNGTGGMIKNEYVIILKKVSECYKLF